MLKNLKHVAATSAIVLAGFSLGSSASAQTLTQAVQHAIRTNPDVQFDIANRFAVGEELNQAKAGWLPNVEISAGVGRERSRNQTAAVIAGAGGSITLNRTESQAILTQNLFNGFGTLSEVRRQRAHLHSAAWKINEVSQDIALNTVEKYLDVMRARLLLEEAQRNLNYVERILSMIRERSDSGLGRKADLEQAESRVALARANVVGQRGRLRDRRTEFARIVGEKPENLKWPKSPSSRDLPNSLSVAMKQAHEDHPAIKSITADVVAAEAQHRSATSELFPKLDLVAQVSRNDNLDGIAFPNNDDYVMLRARYNIFRGGELWAKRRQAAYQIQEANEVRNRVVADTDEEVRLTWYGLRAVSNRLVYVKQHRELAKRTVDAYEEQFKVGKRTLLDLLDGQQEYYRATVDYYDSLHDEVVARYRVLHAGGKLLSYMKVALPKEASVSEPNMFHIL